MRKGVDYFRGVGVLLKIPLQVRSREPAYEEEEKIGFSSVSSRAALGELSSDRNPLSFDKGLLVSAEPRKVHLEETKEQLFNITVYNSEERSTVLQMCGWTDYLRRGPYSQEDSRKVQVGPKL